MTTVFDKKKLRKQMVLVTVYGPAQEDRKE